jgi:hypothetical protein
LKNLRAISASLKRLQKRYPTDSITKIISVARKTTRPWMKGNITDQELLVILTQYEKYNQ